MNSFSEKLTFKDFLSQIQEKQGVLGPVRHSITRFRYEVYSVEAGLWTGDLPEGHVFWNPTDTPPGTLSTLTQKILLIN